MAFNVFNGSISTQNVAISGGLDIMPPSTTQTISVTRTSNGTSTIYTCPAGKVAYVVWATGWHGGSATVTTNTYVNGLLIRQCSAGASASCPDFVPSLYPPQLIEGQTVTYVLAGYSSGNLVETIGILEVSI